MTRTPLNAVAGLLALAAAVAMATPVHADSVKCQRAILKESGKFAQAKIRALSRCEENKLRAKLPLATNCHTEPKAAAAIIKADLKLRAGIDKACGGNDRECSTVGDGNDTLASIFWPGTCPDFEGTGCTNTISNCDDVAECLHCINEAAVDQAIGLYYDGLAGSVPGTQLNKCQVAIGKATSAFFAAKTKALGKCWDARYNGQHVSACPNPGDGKAATAIQKAENKKVNAISRACGPLGLTAVSQIGFVGNCPGVTIPGGSPCGGPVTTLVDLIGCVDCVTEFKVDCEVTLAVPGFQSYPLECVPPPATPTPTPTVTVSPTPTRSPTPTLTPTATRTVTATPTPIIDRCLAGKIRAEGRGAAAYLKCHSKAAAKNVATDPTCLAKAGTKMVTAFAKLDGKGGCALPGDGPARDADTSNHAADVDATVGHAGKCDAAKTKLVGKYVSASMSCHGKAASTSGIVNPGCLSKAASKLTNGVAKEEGKPPCSDLGQGPDLLALADAFILDQLCLLSPGRPGCLAATPTPTPTTTKTATPTLTPAPPTPSATPTSDPSCQNFSDDPGEICDPTTAPAGWAVCGPDFTCTAGCTCACPGKIHFSGDPSDPATILDTGWTGIAHRAPLISNGDVTIAVSCANSQRPCGVCNVSGPIANTGNQLRNQRCNGDTSKQCTNAPGGTGGPCAGAGTCEFYFGAPLPLVAGGVGTCVENQFNGSVSGTANIETGSAVTNVFLTSRVHSAVISTDTPCPVCVGDPTSNDGVQGGTCMGGPRDTLGCDGNGTVFNRPDFGTTSLDCPPPPGTIAVLPIDLSNTTGTVAKAITSGSPNCSAGGLPGGTKCACDTCNNINAEPCDANADCPLSGGNPGICGGRRCIGGTNVGAPCTVASQCPGGGSCARPGEPTKPNGCVDDSTQPMVNGSICIDTFPTGDNEGECPEGPPTGICSLASGHQQRSCTTADDCCDDAPACVIDPPTPGDCEVSNRLCFLDNGLGGSIVASGMSDPPVQDTSEPTLAAVFCIGPTSAPAVNIAAGLPGPGRTTLKGTATGHP